MSNHENYKSEIDTWADMWDEMQDKSVNPQAEKPKQSDAAFNFFGDEPTDNSYDIDSEALLQESEDTVQNPIRMDTVGSDNKQPKPVWVEENLLSEIEKLKKRLFKIENKMARMGQKEKFTQDPVHDDGKKLMDKIESIRNDIEEVSNQLGIQNDPSPFKIKNK